MQFHCSSAKTYAPQTLIWISDGYLRRQVQAPLVFAFEPLVPSLELLRGTLDGREQEERSWQARASRR